MMVAPEWTGAFFLIWKYRDLYPRRELEPPCMIGLYSILPNHPRA